ncbi:MAG: glutathione peroxidase [Betaproteobacteria bacterium]|nr:glutathione peroxidase [Betaproteobacteria bacterium]
MRALMIRAAVALGTVLAGPAVLAAQCPALLDHTFARLQDEAPQSLCQYAGKVVVVVNTASYCGFTPQYKALEKLYADRQKDGLVVLGFPSNDFGAQEPGSNKQIADFCANTFGVKFPMFAKSDVIGKTANPLYRELQQATGDAPKWNFHKFVIGRDGKVAATYPSAIDPLGPVFTAQIDKLLQQH